MTTETSSILIVNDEPDLATLYTAWLDGEYDVETAIDGADALETIDDTIDIVLLDRQLSDRSGEAVLETIRERSLDCQITIITAIEPDFDIVELGFDDYLVKPVSQGELTGVIEQLCLRATYDEQLQELFMLASRKALLNERTTEPERQSSHEYAELTDRMAVLRARVHETVTELLDQDGFRQVCQDIARDSLEE
ncbi:HalX domain-containing protein [Haloarchaeobius amylolyticus]|uniref:HalX domain-containing protein n=1 Tax=Haloarchaeobius amylolyticus TaxID=1198296 RepID=A0ABD6BIH1_9EURY